MARLEPSIVGNVSGRVGEVVFYRRMGQVFVRKYVPKVRDARSGEQLRQRSVFKTMQRLSSLMQNVLHKSMRTAAREEGMLASNLFLRLNARCCTVEGEHTTVDFSRLQVAAGACPGLVAERAKQTGMRFELRFSGKVSEYVLRGDDMVCVYAYCPDMEEGYEALPTMRAAKKMAFVLPEEWKGHEVYFYAYCLDYARDLTSSNSLFVGCFVAGEKGEVKFEEEADNEEYNSTNYGYPTTATEMPQQEWDEAEEEIDALTEAKPPQRE